MIPQFCWEIGLSSAFSIYVCIYTYRYVFHQWESQPYLRNCIGKMMQVLQSKLTA